jgi:heme exporter protein D
MDENIARVVMAGVIGGTIAISMIAMAVARIVASARRRKELPDSSIARLEARLERMEQAIDAMATEVERVADGQRFTSRLLAERQVERQP